MNMNKPCQAIATAKHKPTYFRLRSNHAENGPRNNVWAADAATTRYMKGTAQRTENEIISDTPAPVDISARIVVASITADIGTETSQNNRHPLMALLASNTFSLVLTMTQPIDTAPA